MLETVRDHFDRTGQVIGVKAAGGISNTKAALHMLVLVKETLGDDWLTPERFRIGASSLLNDLLLQYASSKAATTGAPRTSQRSDDGHHRAHLAALGLRAAPESRDAATLKPSYDLFIGGEFVAPSDGTRVATINPASEEPLAEVAFAGPKDVARAVEAARGAAAGWAALHQLERGKYLFRIARLLQEHAREFRDGRSLDGGKPIHESRDVDVPLAAAHFFSTRGWADKLQYALHGTAHGRVASSARSSRRTSRC